MLPAVVSSAPQHWRIQPKLEIGAVDDPLEREADAISESVMRAPDEQPSDPLGKFGTAGGILVSRAAEGPARPDVPPLVENVLASPGEAFDTQPRQSFESKFGHGFENVRVHRDATAADSASMIGARAYTAGDHIVFARDQYNSSSLEGQKLIAHELVHTLQQGTSVQRQVPDAGAPATQPAQAPGATNADASPAEAGGGAAPAGPASGSKLNIEFNAFIPGSLGSSFASYDHPTDLKNQPAFDAAIKSLPGTWLEEPDSVAYLGNGAWCYATDNRGFGGGAHRVGFTGSIAQSDIGHLGGKTSFTHDTSGSTHVRWKHTGYVTSKDETGSLDGPYSKSAPVTSKETAVDNSPDESTVTTSGAAAYPFSSLSPDIDYALVFDVKRDAGGKTNVKFDVTNNLFPYYELLINGGSVWTYKSSDTGPGNVNLRRSTTFKSGWWTF